ncbi:MAG: type I methionyl aminopeptidase [Chloroflexi bacterium]|nr:type I methionyl aminopeptidase [Chloroflexota bacterium]
MIVIKSKNELAQMRAAGLIVAQALDALRGQVKPGVSTAELDQFIHGFVTKRKAYPTFKGYRGFPASICASINNEVVHGIPNKKRILQEGDIISIDVGATLNGFVGDSAMTYPVGKISAGAQRLIQVTEGALWAAISQSRAGRYLEDISAAVQDYAEARGYSIVREYVGHGVGRTMHEEPQIPNYRQGKRGPLLKPGMTLAIEPMINEGKWETRVLRDKWTVVTKDGRLSAHFEHTVAITEGEPEILTRLDS